MPDYPNEPPEDPQERFCKSVCGRIAGGLIEEASVDDLQEVVRWLNDAIYYRINPYIPPADPF